MFETLNLGLAMLPIGIAVLYFFWRLEQRIEKQGQQLERMYDIVQRAIERSTKEHAELAELNTKAIETTISEHREMTNVLKELALNIVQLNGKLDLHTEKLRDHVDEERARGRGN